MLRDSRIEIGYLAQQGVCHRHRLQRIAQLVRQHCQEFGLTLMGVLGGNLPVLGSNGRQN